MPSQLGVVVSSCSRAESGGTHKGAEQRRGLVGTPTTNVALDPSGAAVSRPEGGSAGSPPQNAR